VESTYAEVMSVFIAGQMITIRLSPTNVLLKWRPKMLQLQQFFLYLKKINN